MEIVRLAWPRYAIARLRGHDIEPSEVEVLISGTFAVDVHPDHPDQVRITGRTHLGRFLTIALEMVDEARGLWRPVTGWTSSAAEEAYYWRESL